MSRSNPFRRSHVPAGDERLMPHSPESLQSPQSLERRNQLTDADEGPPSLRIQVPAQSRTTSTTKRVRIASPPVPITPETPASYSYPSSPEAARDATLPYSPPPVGLGQAPYNRLLVPNPFNPSTSDGEQDDVDGELLENTKKNAVRLGQDANVEQVDKNDSVKTTLARFASIPRRRSTAPATHAAGQRDEGHTPSSRQSMDLDAFKRLLLTGMSEAPSDPSMHQTRGVLPHTVLTSDSSSSNADTASLSQQSLLFEQLAPATFETPRTSNDTERDEVNTSDQDALISRSIDGPFKKPRLPRIRHRKSLEDGQSIAKNADTSLVAGSMTQSSTGHFPDSQQLTSGSDLNKPLPIPPVDNSFPQLGHADEFPTMQSSPSTRRPPILPLARRHSQRQQSYREESADSSFISGLSSTPPSIHGGDQSSKESSRKPPPPPPPPSRRQKGMSEVSQHPSQPEVLEETIAITSEPASLSSSPSTSSLPQVKPQPPPSRQASLAKRQSRVSAGSPVAGPPPRPPQRVRGSSRSSVDSNSVFPLPDTRNEVEPVTHENASARTVSGQSNSRDILADLAALQQEVDALRNQQKAPPNG